MSCLDTQRVIGESLVPLHPARIIHFIGLYLSIEIKLKCILDSNIKRDLWFPVEFGSDLCGVNGISDIMTLSICYIGDIFISFSHLSKDNPRDLQVGVFIVSSDIVDRLRVSTSEDFPDSITMISDIEPISDIGSIAIDGDLLIILEEFDKMWDEFLVILIWTIVIRTPRDHIIYPKRSPICLHDEITPRLGCAIWTRWIDRS